MFLDNKYSRIYNQIVSAAKSKSRSKKDDEYYENHHIIPRSLGGSDLSENLVLLTAKEHYLCHWLLMKMTGGRDYYKMTSAFSKMVFCKNSSQKRNYTSAQYERAKKIFSKARKGVKTGRPAWNKGLTVSDPRVKRNIEASLITKSQRIYIISQQTKEKLSYHSRTRPRTPLSDKHKKNLSLKKSGISNGPHSVETKQKQSGVEYYDPKTLKVIRFKAYMGEVPPNDWIKGRPSMKKWIWVTNGNVNRKINITQEIPDGFMRGRSVCRNEKGIFV